MHSSKDVSLSKTMPGAKPENFYLGKHSARQRLIRPGNKKLEIAHGRLDSAFYTDSIYREGYMHGCALFALEKENEQSSIDFALSLAGYAMGLDFKLRNPFLNIKDVTLEKMKSLIVIKFGFQFSQENEFNSLFQERNLALIREGFTSATIEPKPTQPSLFHFFSAPASPLTLPTLQIDFKRGDDEDNKMIDQLNTHLSL